MTREIAIENVKEFLNGTCLRMQYQEAFETLIPELAESEDEKIKNYILRLCNEIIKANGVGLELSMATTKRLAAYLEKQKALSELSKYIAAERTKPGFMFSGNNSVSWEELPLKVRKHDYPYYFIGDLDCYPFVVEEKKPAEWSKEDDALLKEIVSFFKDGTVKLQHDLDLYAGFLENKFKSLRPQSKQEWSEEDEDMLACVIDDVKEHNKTKKYKHQKEIGEMEVAWLKDLSLSLKKRNEDVAKLCSNEWSEEDEERLINTSISFLKDFADKGYENAVECIDWLKSKLNGNSGK